MLRGIVPRSRASAAGRRASPPGRTSTPAAAPGARRPAPSHAPSTRRRAPAHRVPAPIVSSPCRTIIVPPGARCSDRRAGRTVMKWTGCGARDRARALFATRAATHTRQGIYLPSCDVRINAHALVREFKLACESSRRQASTYLGGERRRMGDALRTGPRSRSTGARSRSTGPRSRSRSRSPAAGPGV